MILPTKGVPASKALITVGGEILEVLGAGSLSLSGLWHQHSELRRESTATRISYDWFILAVDLLFCLGAVQMSDLGLLRRVTT